jgi:hypothetical protein
MLEIIENKTGIYEIYYFIFNKTAVTIKQPIRLFPELII